MNNKKDGSLISVGIDIGTTTTHLVVSRLAFNNVSLANAAPNLAISSREIIYESSIFLTPLTADGEIEAEQAAALIANAYSEIGLKTNEIDTGALIITGQSARARNASAVSQHLAELAGGFVVESAGPHLESVLAARGSQAVEYSKSTGLTVLNIDIGGGTSNYALIENGQITETACMNVGGRMIQFEEKNGHLVIAKISDSARLLYQSMPDCKFAFVPGQIVASEALKKFADCMADAILNIGQCDEYKELLLTPDLNLNLNQNLNHNIDQIWISGGVAAAADQELMAYSDMGVYLARALAQRQNRNYKITAGNPVYKIAPRAIRATVIGAGLHTLQLSGSTIGFSEANLPLRNLKLIAININSDQLFTDQIHKQLQQREHHWQEGPVALVLTGLKKETISFVLLKSLAENLSQAFLESDGCEPLVIVAEVDVAMALNLFLSGILKDKRIITVDGINAADGDYIDIGKPVSISSDANTQSLPIVVKTLLFYKSAE